MWSEKTAFKFGRGLGIVKQKLPLSLGEVSEFLSKTACKFGRGLGILKQKLPLTLGEGWEL